MVEDYEALYLLQNVLKSITVQIHNQKSETVYRVNCNGILLDVRQLIPENGKRGKKRCK